MKPGFGIKRIIDKMLEAKVDGEPGVKPKHVNWGVCKQNVVYADDVDLTALPAPMAHQADGGKYIHIYGMHIMPSPGKEWKRSPSLYDLHIKPNPQSNLWAASRCILCLFFVMDGDIYVIEQETRRSIKHSRISVPSDNTSKSGNNQAIEILMVETVMRSRTARNIRYIIQPL